MPVISPRRSSTSASGSLYGTSTTSSSAGASSSSYSAATSYLDRANSLSKATGSSSASAYSPSFSSYLSTYSSYSPRTSAYRNSSSSYLTGGSTGLGTYRPTSLYTSLSSNDTTATSRYGLNKRSTKIKDDYSSRHETKKPPTGSSTTSSSSTAASTDAKQKRLSGTSSSSSLARLVATSGLDLYEKYSPAHYKPNCELSRSRSSAHEADNDDAATATNTTTTTATTVARRTRTRTPTKTTTTTTTTDNDVSATIKLDRARSRYSRLYSDDSDSKDHASTSNNAAHRSSLRSTSGSRSKATNSTSGITNSSSSGDVPTATFTLRSNRLRSTKALNDEADATLKNGILNSSSNSSLNGIDALGSTQNQLKDLKISPSASASSLNAYKIKTADSDSNSNSLDVNNNINKDKKDKKEYDNDKHDKIGNEISDNGNDNETTANVSGVSGGSDVSVIATLKLDTTTTTPLTKSNKVRSTTARSVLPPSSPTATRYWDRESSRSSLASTYPSNLDYASKPPPVDEASEGLCGLRNIGNTCFMNSVIQCLSHTYELTKFLRSKDNGIRTSASSIMISKDQLILNEFVKLIREMWTTNVNSVTPMELKRAFSTKHRMYSDYNQQDAQEFLRFFLDSLHSALNTGVKGEHLKIDDNLSDNRKADLTWEWYARHENSLIRDLFVGQLKSTLRCTNCGNTSVTFDPFWDLSVPLPSLSRCKLDACLDLFIREEVLDGDEMPTCSKCQMRRKCTKSFTIQRFPKYLVIHLKRFSETRWSKLTNIVEFPTGDRDLNMGPYGSNPNMSIYYSLYGISNHMGSTAGGHYVALCKHPVSKRWHEFNDNIVSDAVSESHLVSSSAYILFYERA